MKRLILAALFAASSLTSTMSLAQEQVKLSAAEKAEYSATLTTARALASYGESKGDALALLVAARMIESVPGPKLADGQDPSAGTDNLKFFDTATLVSKAKELAPADALVTKTASELSVSPQANTRGACYWAYYCNYYGCWYEWACYY